MSKIEEIAARYLDCYQRGGDPFDKLTIAALRELLEECCREECCLCAAGIPVEADGRWGYVHPAGSKMPSGKEAVIDAPCGAARLRRLGE